MKKVLVLLLAAIVLAGCAGKGKTAEQHGKGISVEMAGSPTIKHITVVQYVNGREIVGESVINADGSALSNGENVWFDVPLSKKDKLEIALEYSEKNDGTNPRTTRRVDISEARAWVTLKLNEENQLEFVNAK
ncbi:hypothetical protein A8F94_08760 [Bacillus sp. FJAT-27225]|uniref:lipoprotein n=1 Tax=Bacillus sp. FJAT-27225 TaxID=1743144 RepID=UPI00080C31B0|nr:hypothetical protein [Bacillus sp. FJAT-27225]OCA87912.1 hypothetical protein A8F94_08760 [Bacillus sp. FJAT-27225]